MDKQIEIQRKDKGYKDREKEIELERERERGQKNKDRQRLQKYKDVNRQIVEGQREKVIVHHFGKFNHGPREQFS